MKGLKSVVEEVKRDAKSKVRCAELNLERKKEEYERQKMHEMQELHRFEKRARTDFKSKGERATFDYIDCFDRIKEARGPLPDFGE